MEDMFRVFLNSKKNCSMVIYKGELADVCSSAFYFFQQSYGAPAKRPTSSYGAPSRPTSTYGAPSRPTSTYGAPSRPTSTYGAPSRPQSTYGAPKKAAPAPSYGAPRPQQSYGAPKKAAPQKKSKGYGSSF